MRDIQPNIYNDNHINTRGVTTGLFAVAGAVVLLAVLLLPVSILAWKSLAYVSQAEDAIRQLQEDNQQQQRQPAKSRF